jgi:hypothetical protein
MDINGLMMMMKRRQNLLLIIDSNQKALVIYVNVCFWSFPYQVIFRYLQNSIKALQNSRCGCMICGPFFH